MRIFLLLFLVFFAFEAKADKALETILQAPVVRVGDSVLDRAALNAFYLSRKFDRAWDEKAKAVLDVLSAASAQGLNPHDYHVDEISSRLNEKDQAGRAVLDLLISDSLMRYVADVHVGRVSPRQLAGERFRKQQSIDPVAAVAEAAVATDVTAYLNSILPRSAEYQGLVALLAMLRAMPDWPQIADGPRLEKGREATRVGQLRARLAATGELGEAAPTGKKFDAALEAALKVYQQGAGLHADGVAGKETMNTLNVTRSARIQQVLANMERMRWLPPDLGARSIVVNVPGFELTAYEAGQPVFQMATIVGRDERRTPIFSDNIQYLEFNPVWHVPPTIVREDILPHMAENPFYAKEHKNVSIYHDGVEVDPLTVDWARVDVRTYRMRAPPGPQNPLGTVKFMFPNRFSVYLHDTSERDKFAKDMRALSSGCVRVSDPAKLTNWLLADKDGWNEAKRLEIMALEKQRRIDMKTPVPVHLIYLTAWLRADGKPAFRRDIYNFDMELAGALTAASAQPRPMAVSMIRGSLGRPQIDPVNDPNEKVEVAAP
jgi:murein L,D-transpeptidase YcbB/YkuD